MSLWLCHVVHPAETPQGSTGAAGYAQSTSQEDLRKLLSHHLRSAEEQRPPPRAQNSHDDGQDAESLTESRGTQELKGWLYLSASQLAGTRTCLGGHREVWTGPSHSCCRTDFIWNMSLMVQPLVQFSSVSQSLPTICDPMVQHTRPCCPSPTPRVYSNSCPLSW